MACAHPFQYRPQKTLLNHPVYNIPCGWCACCRKDKQNYIIDRANYEYKKRLTASFVTFTYSQLHLLDRCVVKNCDGSIKVDDKGNPLATLRYDDVQNFIMNLRKFIQSRPDIHGVMCQPDFSYMYVGEYGDSFNRPHYHVIFFGLDFAFCKKLFMDKWKYGLIDVLPVLDGGISYVTKYMDKQVFGALAYELYDFKGLSRPRLRMSLGFGKGLLLDNIDDIKSHDYSYRISKNMRRPISAYWKSLLTGNVFQRDKSLTYSSVARQIDNMNNYFREINLPQINYDRYSSHSLFSAQSYISDYKIKKARLREYNLALMSRSDGVPYVSPDEVIFSKFGHASYSHDKINKLSEESKRILSNDFILDLLYGDEVPF